MPLHLIKLCVGIDSVEDLRAWRAQRAAQGHVARPGDAVHKAGRRQVPDVEGAEGGCDQQHKAGGKFSPRSWAI